MKFLPRFLLLLFCSALMADEIDLSGRLPQDFDWRGYFEHGDQSTGGQASLANSAVTLLKTRVDQLCTEYRVLMKKRGDTEALKLFDEMQQHWQRAADAEVAFVGSAWGDGSGAKEAYPKHRFKVYFRRLKELLELKGDSLHLNE